MKLKKRFGQHFLKDRGIIKRIVDSGEVKSTDRVVEIGPGGGALTEEILKRKPSELIAIEIDPEWVKYLTEKFGNRIRLIEADATTFDFSSLGKELNVFGNLPYNVSTSILRNLLNHRKSIKRGTFMVQKEVAERLSARQGKEYGYLPALLQLFFKIKKLFDVHPGAFVPPPKVVSSVITLTPTGFDIEESELKSFESFLKKAFSARRKKLKKNLGIKKPSQDIAEFLEKRAEELEPEKLLWLFRKLNAKS